MFRAQNLKKPKENMCFSISEPRGPQETPGPLQRPQRSEKEVPGSLLQVQNTQIISLFGGTTHQTYYFQVPKPPKDFADLGYHAPDILFAGPKHPNYFAILGDHTPHIMRSGPKSQTYFAVLWYLSLIHI